MSLQEKLEYLESCVALFDTWSDEDKKFFIERTYYKTVTDWTQEERVEFMTHAPEAFPDYQIPTHFIPWLAGLVNIDMVEVYKGELLLKLALTGDPLLDELNREAHWAEVVESYDEGYLLVKESGFTAPEGTPSLEESFGLLLTDKFAYRKPTVVPLEAVEAVESVLPELFILLTILTFLSVNVFFCNFYVSVGRTLGYQSGILVLLSLFFLILLLWEANFYSFFCFGESLSKDFFSYFVNLLILVGSICVCIFWLVYTVDHEAIDFEFFLFILIVVLGSFVITNSNDFLSLYIGIELQSLCLYVMAGSKVRSTFSTESGVKYFVLGGLASSLFLFGVSLTYGFVGTLNFNDLQVILLSGADDFLQKSGLCIGFFFLFCGLIFKVGGAPFYLWVPDVYEGAPLSVTGFFAVVPKLAIFSVLVKIGSLNILQFTPEVADLLLYSGMLSIFVGSVGALTQTTIKRLLSYSAISHSGFLLYALSTQIVEGVVCALFYLVVYVLVLCNVFGILVGTSLHFNNSSIKLIDNLRYIFRSNPVFGYSLMLSIFSIAGIPPLSGFFSKFFVFFAAIKGGLYLSAAVCILLSVIGSVYYLKLIRSLMFIRNTSQWVFFAPVRREVAYLVVYSGMFNVFFCFFGFDLLNFLYENIILSLGLC